MLQLFNSQEVQRQLTQGVPAHEVKVDVRLSILKPKHADWIVSVFNKFQSEKGRKIILSGFRKSHITEALSMSSFPQQDPFV